MLTDNQISLDCKTQASSLKSGALGWASERDVNGQETVKVTAVLCYLIGKRFAEIITHNVFQPFELRSEQRETTATIK